MSSNAKIKHEGLFNAVRVMSNSQRFRILELCQDKAPSISELSATLKLAYTKTVDYVKMLENLKLVTKTRNGKQVMVKSNVKLTDCEVRIV